MTDVMWWSGGSAGCACMVCLILRNQLVRVWWRVRHIPTYTANHRIEETPMAEIKYRGRHRCPDDPTGPLPAVQLPLDPTTVVVDGELVAEVRDDAELVTA